VPPFKIRALTWVLLVSVIGPAYRIAFGETPPDLAVPKIRGSEPSMVYHVVPAGAVIENELFFEIEPPCRYKPLTRKTGAYTLG
jgi:hypothetical protein